MNTVQTYICHIGIVVTYSVNNICVLECCNEMGAFTTWHSDCHVNWFKFITSFCADARYNIMFIKLINLTCTVYSMFYRKKFNYHHSAHFYLFLLSFMKSKIIFISNFVVTNTDLWSVKIYVDLYVTKRTMKWYTVES